MKVTMWCRWFVTLSFVSLSAFVVSAPPADSQSLAGSGSMRSHPGGNQETHTPTMPKGSKADAGIRSIRPPDMPGQAPVPRERTEALEERLRNGQMEKPVAQGQVSDRLEQLHRGSAESSPGDTITGQTAQ
jgi:hypothetical protein